MIQITDEINDILELGYSLATEQYYLKLFDLVLDGCVKFTGSDAGTLYLVDTHIDENGKTNISLRGLTTINKTLGFSSGQMAGEEETISLDANNVIFWAISHKKPYISADIYQETAYDITQFKQFDSDYRYRTKSVMVVPIMKNANEVLGAVSLINCKNTLGEVISFPQESVRLVSSLTSQMAISLKNMLHLQDLNDLLDSFVSAMTTAIDARTPYNANHTNNVAMYCMDFADYINAMYTRGEFRLYIDENDREQLKMAAKLHDWGKMITSREVLNKSTRLGNLYDNLLNKLEKISLMMKIDKLEGRMDDADYAMADLRLTNFIAELPILNTSGALSEADIERVTLMHEKQYVTPEGTVIPYLDEEEFNSLMITRGTLTPEERIEVEKHVEYTDKMLAEIKFNSTYNRVRKIAANHHEYLDGSGYPKHLTANELDILTRILTIADIFDSLVANDRPYKKPLDPLSALAVLDGMVDEGKLDKELVKMFDSFIQERI